MCLRVFVIAWLSIGALAAQTPVLSKNDRDISRTMLRQIREDLERHYDDPTFHGIDLWSMSMIGDQALVADVAAGSDAAAKGIERGDRVLSLNRFQPARDNFWQIRYLYHFVRPQAQQHLVVRKPDGTERTLDVLSKVTNKSIEQLDDLIDEIEAPPLVLDHDAPCTASGLRNPGMRHTRMSVPKSAGPSSATARLGP